MDFPGLKIMTFEKAQECKHSDDMKAANNEKEHTDRGKPDSSIAQD